MEYTILGKTGRKVSRIGFGGATAGLKNYVQAFDPHKSEDREMVIKAIRKACELGINYFDTAAGYGDGASEEIFGEGLSGIPNESIFLATKVSRGDADATRRSLEASIKRLKRDSIDLIQIHGTEYKKEHYEMIMEKGGMLEALEKAKEEGLVKHIGFSIECQNEQLYNFIKSKRFDVIQTQYNLLFQHPDDPSWNCGSLYDAEEDNLGIVSMRTATSGIFQKWIKLVHPESNYNYNPALIQFVLSNPLIDVALLGMRTEEMVIENVNTCNDLSGRIDLEVLHKRYV